MNQIEINSAIHAALHNLCETNEMLFDYWLNELYDTYHDEPISDQWNESNLKLMEDDVMNQMLA